MSWEHSITFAFIGAGLVIAFIGNSIKSDEQSIEWTRFIPIGLRTLLYFVAFGMVMFAIGVQGPIMIQNEIYVNDTAVNATASLRNAIDGGVTITTLTFYSLIILLVIFCIVLIIGKVFLGKNWLKGKGKGEGYDEY